MILGLLYSSTLSSFNLYSLVKCCDRLKDQESKLLATINQIQSNIDLKNSEKKILRDLYMQIITIPLEFTTAGYYTINFKFLAGIVIGVA